MMMEKPITIAVAGCGSRGLEAYASKALKYSDRMKIVAVSDTNPGRLARAKKMFGLNDDQCYDSAEAMLAKGRLAEVLFLCTPDRDHYKEAMTALALDYHLLLEKPISMYANECRDIERLALERRRQVVVCHVLRYTVFYQKLKEIIDSGAIGDVVSVQAIEAVGHWHQAHSFIRGNWRNAGLSSPMILQKCCHDMDILLWLTGKHCKRVSSFGSLKHFNAEHAPEGAPARCTDGCPAANTCPYNAVRFYMGRAERGWLGWPVNVLDPNPTVETIGKALREGPYGRCVYRCDNDVVDHQVVNLDLEDGVTVSFTMCGHTNYNNREIRIMGTRGEIRGDMEKKALEVLKFCGEQDQAEKEIVDITKFTTDFSGHMGGDVRMIDDLLDLITGEGDGTALSDITKSVESHLVALAAEKSRLNNGAVVEISEM